MAIRPPKTLYNYREKPLTAQTMPLDASLDAITLLLLANEQSVGIRDVPDGGVEISLPKLGALGVLHHDRSVYSWTAACFGRSVPLQDWRSAIRWLLRQHRELWLEPLLTRKNEVSLGSGVRIERSTSAPRDVQWWWIHQGQVLLGGVFMLDSLRIHSTLAPALHGAGAPTYESVGDAIAAVVQARGDFSRTGVDSQ